MGTPLSRFIIALETDPRLNRWSNRLQGWPVVGRLWIMMLENPRRVERFTKFAIVGAIGALVDFAVLNIMKRVFESVGLGVGWALAMEPHQVQLVAANTLSFSAAVLSNFTWNRLWTFPESRERPVGSQLFQFATVSILGLVINTLILVLMDRHVFQHFFDERLSYNLAKAIAIGVVLFWNFAMNLLWTYRGIAIGGTLEPESSATPGSESGQQATRDTTGGA